MLSKVLGFDRVEVEICCGPSGVRLHHNLWLLMGLGSALQPDWRTAWQGQVPSASITASGECPRVQHQPSELAGLKDE